MASASNHPEAKAREVGQKQDKATCQVQFMSLSSLKVIICLHSESRSLPHCPLHCLILASAFSGHCYSPLLSPRGTVLSAFKRSKSWWNRLMPCFVALQSKSGNFAPSLEGALAACPGVWAGVRVGVRHIQLELKRIEELDDIG